MKTLSVVAWGQVVAKAWMDPTFAAELLAQPAATLRGQGLEVRDDVVVALADADVPNERGNVLRLPKAPHSLARIGDSNEAKAQALSGSYCYCGITVAGGVEAKADGSYCYCGVTVTDAAM